MQTTLVARSSLSVPSSDYPDATESSTIVMELTASQTFVSTEVASQPEGGTAQTDGVASGATEIIRSTMPAQTLIHDATYSPDSTKVVESGETPDSTSTPRSTGIPQSILPASTVPIRSTLHPTASRSQSSVLLYSTVIASSSTIRIPVASFHVTTEEAGPDATLARAETKDSSEDLGLLVASILAMVVFVAVFIYLMFRENQRQQVEKDRAKMKKKQKESQESKDPKAN
jgi:hypothetical protein